MRLRNRNIPAWCLHRTSVGFGAGYNSIARARFHDLGDTTKFVEVGQSAGCISKRDICRCTVGPITATEVKDQHVINWSNWYSNRRQIETPRIVPCFLGSCHDQSPFIRTRRPQTESEGENSTKIPFIWGSGPLGWSSGVQQILDGDLHETLGYSFLNRRSPQSPTRTRFAEALRAAIIGPVYSKCCGISVVDFRSRLDV